MFHSKNFSMTQNNIISCMMSEDRPITVRELSKNLNCSYQTVANNLPELKARRIVIEAGKRHNAMTYILGNPTETLTAMVWQGEETNVIKFLENISTGQSPVAKNVFGREVIHFLKEMLRLSTDHLDDEDPKPLTIAQLKEIQSRLAMRRKQIKQLLETLDSLLNNDELWEPSALVKALIIRDESMTIPKARSIIQGITERMEDK